MAKTPIEPIYKQYSAQIDAILEMMDFSNRKAAKVVSWLYGGSDETWRKLFASKKPNKVPKEVQELFHKFKEK